MNGTACRHQLRFLVIGLAFAIFPSTTLAQTCPSEPAKGGRICTTPGAPCSPVTDGSGSKGKCTTEGSVSDVRSCECKGSSYNMALTPLAPPAISGPSGPNPATAVSTITISPFNGYTGTVNFTCSISGGSPPLPSCPNPPPVTVTGGPVNSTLSVSAVDATTTATYTFTVSAVDSDGLPPNTGPQSSSVFVGHDVWTVGGGGGVAILTLAMLLALWSIARLWRQRIDSR